MVVMLPLSLLSPVPTHAPFLYDVNNTATSINYCNWGLCWSALHFGHFLQQSSYAADGNNDEGGYLIERLNVSILCDTFVSADCLRQVGWVGWGGGRLLWALSFLTRFLCVCDISLTLSYFNHTAVGHRSVRPQQHGLQPLQPVGDLVPRVCKQRGSAKAGDCYRCAGCIVRCR